jgi:hypothetical protein
VHATLSLLGCIERLIYIYHDVSDTNKFPEFAQHAYMESLGKGPLGDPILQPKKSASGLENTGILNFLEIPHFGLGKDVKNYVKKLLAALHGRFLWLEEPISIDVDLIAFITGLPSNGEKPV